MTETPSAPSEPQIPAASSHPSPGAALRSAREKLGLTVDEVSLQTKIPSPLLHAMEAELYARLGQPVYVRGYLRKYARAVRASEAEIVAAYDAREAPAQPQPEQMLPARTAPPEEPAPSGALRWIVLLILIAAAAAALWYFSGDRPMRSVRPAPPPAAPVTQESLPQSSPPEAQPAPSSATEAPAPDPATAAPQSPDGAAAHAPPGSSAPPSNPATPLGPPPVNDNSPGVPAAAPPKPPEAALRPRALPAAAGAPRAGRPALRTAL